MRGLVRGRRIVTTKRSTPSAGDLVNRRFNAEAPNRLWVTDLTYVRTTSGWVYVAFMIDVFKRRIVGWDGSSSMSESLVSSTLTMALEHRDRTGHPVATGLVHHSDHGSQYTALHYTEQLALAGIAPSYGSVGDAYDNALAETVNGSYKAECVNQDGPFHTLADVLDATADQVHWWNTARLHENLGYLTPDEAETMYYSHQQPLENHGSTQ